MLLDMCHTKGRLYVEGIEQGNKPKTLNVVDVFAVEAQI
jgi:hypothetical protein